jgi:hypothetical protein
MNNIISLSPSAADYRAPRIQATQATAAEPTPSQPGPPLVDAHCATSFSKHELSNYDLQLTRRFFRGAAAPPHNEVNCKLIMSRGPHLPPVWVELFRGKTRQRQIDFSTVWSSMYLLLVLELLQIVYRGELLRLYVINAKHIMG